MRETLPEGFQHAEFLKDKGAIDMIVARKDMRDEIARLIALMMLLPNPDTAVAEVKAAREQNRAGRKKAASSSGKKAATRI